MERDELVKYLADKDDVYEALLMAAIDVTEGDIDKAIELADAAYEN